MKKIFFVGNSYTGFNDMPTMFKKLAVAGGFDVVTDKVTKGGCDLRTYLTKGDERGDRFYSIFESEDWDCVILQEQSARPAIDESEFASAADEMCDLIYKKGAEPLFYQTWPYRNKTEKLATTNCTYIEFYQKLRDAYRRAAAKNHADFVPIGDVFYRMSINHPEVNLLLEDNYHPNFNGSYLIALMFYFYFFGKEAPVLYRPEEVTEDAADIIIASIKETI